MDKILSELSINTDANQAVYLLRVLVSRLRPTFFERKGAATIKLQKLIAQLKTNNENREALRNNILLVVHQSDVSQLFLETGIISKGSFWSEISKKLSHKILPPVEDENSINAKIQQIFIEDNDFEWIVAIEDSVWEDFFTTLNFKTTGIPQRIKSQMFNALKVLSFRVASLGLEKEIIGKISTQDELLSPFLLQNKEIYDLISLLNTGLDAADVASRFEKITDLINQCTDNLKLIKEKTTVNGASLHQSFIIKRIEQMIARMQLTTDLMYGENFNILKFVKFFKQVIYEEQNKNRLRELFSDNVSLLSYQIAEHKSKSGDHYIARNLKEYKKFFRAACGGGVIISFVVIFKILIHHAHYAPFWEAVMYSLNYAMGFILIHVTHSSLATKQPAMTASALARALDVKASGIQSNQNFSQLIAKVWSSQTISFVGNLLIVFPLTLLWVVLLEKFAGYQLVDTIEAGKMLDSNNPFKSLAWFYAAITGFFLFLSGIISGYYDNKVIYDHIPKRIVNHPYLKKMLPNSWLVKFAHYMEHNLGSLVGNFLLGFFLGTATFIGEILGWPYDIRHITISSGYFSIGVYQNFSVLPWWEILAVFVGVLGVGFTNFLVSFSLAFFVALKARSVKLSNYSELLDNVLSYLKSNPKEFIVPSDKDNGELKIY